MTNWCTFTSFAARRTPTSETAAVVYDILIDAGVEEVGVLGDERSVVVQVVHINVRKLRSADCDVSGVGFV